MYNLKEANKDFVSKAAFLASDMRYDPDCPPTEKQVEKWRDYTMYIISQHQQAHQEIRRQREEGAKQCAWKFDSGSRETECGKFFTNLTVDDSFIYCPYCGREVVGD